ncbi:hypothetical protein M405DRAFT_859982 [Rhizopogon salebrosus TDB-379]|nr:hypothetical protein M405DRAFT_859982 [Rhizopogon salebrosus TDB-379]
MKLAELYEIMDESRIALELIYEANAGTRPQGASLFEEKSRTKAKAQLLEEAGSPWPKHSKRNASEKCSWGTSVSKIFGRECRMIAWRRRGSGCLEGMFPKRRMQRRDNADEDGMASRLELNERDRHIRRNKDDGHAPVKVNSFRGVSFASWRRIFIQRGDYDQAEEVLRHILLSNAYRDSDSQITIRTAIITCAIFAGRFSVAPSDTALPMRLFFQHHDCKNDIHSENSGFMIPQSKLQNSSNGMSSIKEEPSKVNDGEEDADDDAEIPGSTESTTTEKMATRMLTKNNPVIITLYGQMCLAAKSYQNAISRSWHEPGDGFLVSISESSDDLMMFAEVDYNFTTG